MLNRYTRLHSHNGSPQTDATALMNQLILPATLVADLQQVEQLVLDRLDAQSVVLRIAGQHVLNSGGKRLRALLTLLGAQLGEYNIDRVIHAAAAVELIHTASLVHDDLVDQAERRRGTITVHARWDNGVALMVGDYFFALAAGEMALSPDTRIITYFSDAVMTICEGELTPVMVALPLETALEQYYYKIGCKTASLFAAACKAGMVAGGGTQEQIDVLGMFGYDLGLAFQVVDDILDFTGDAERLGKPAGSDVRQGIITLPLIYAVADGGGERLASVVDNDDEHEVLQAIEEVRWRGIEPAQQEARKLIDRALSHLELFPNTPARQLLTDIAHFVLHRDV